MATNITDFSNRCRGELPGCPMSVINQAVVDAIIQFCEDTHRFRFGFEYDILSTDVDETDNNAVTIDLSTVSGNPYSSMRPYSFDLFKIDGATFPTERYELSTDITDLSNIRYGSMRYFSFPSQTTVKIWPLEVQDATLYIALIFKPIIGISTIDDFIFYDYHEAIEALAKYNLMRQKGKKWSDIKQSMTELGEYNEKVGLARIGINLGKTNRSQVVESKYLFC